MSVEKPTLRDLAKHLNLALSTVSMALRDNPEIAKATCQRVKEAAKEIGYVPDPRVSNVMGYLKKMRKDKPVAALAYISSYSNEIVLQNHPVFQNYYEGARVRAEELGYHLESFNLEKEGLSGRRLTSILLSRGIEGVIIPPLFNGIRSIEIELERFASITFGFSFHQEPINRVTLDHFHGAMLALEKIAEKGYRRIGLIFGPNTNERMQYRWVAALYAFYAKQKGQVHIKPLELDLTPDTVLAWYRESKPDAILSMRIDWAPYLAEEGYHCGIDFSFAHLEHESIRVHCGMIKDEELANEFRNAAGLDQQSNYIGSHAVELLARDLAMNVKGPPKHPSITLIEGMWREGATLPLRSELATKTSSAV